MAWSNNNTTFNLSVAHLGDPIPYTINSTCTYTYPPDDYSLQCKSDVDEIHHGNWETLTAADHIMITDILSRSLMWGNFFGGREFVEEGVGTQRIVCNCASFLKSWCFISFGYVYNYLLLSCSLLLSSSFSAPPETNPQQTTRNTMFLSNVSQRQNAYRKTRNLLGPVRLGCGQRISVTGKNHPR